MMHGQKNIKPF